MTDRRLRYSERLEVAETGALAPLDFDRISDEFRRAFVHLVNQAADTSNVGKGFMQRLAGALIEHFGLGSPIRLDELVEQYPTLRFLDIAEIATEEAEQPRRYQKVVGRAVGGGTRYDTFTKAAMPDFSDRFNNLADRHRLGYRLEGGEIRRIGSPALAETVVGPAVLASRRAGWDQVERSYKEALRHQRGGTDENDDALTASAAALESALKASGVQGSTLGQLSKAFTSSSLAAPQLQNVPELLRGLLERSAAVRNTHGDAHGRAPGDDPDVPQELVDLAVHLTGSFIVYLERTSRLA